MKFQELYLNSLDRKVNPAVSASDLDEATIDIEIKEYVFTKEILNNLFNILDNIRENKGSHTGIWINGYYGSGKSHFLKYISYCLSPKYGDRAMERFREAVNEYKPLELDFELGDLDALIRWLKEKASVQTVMFNIGAVHNANSRQEVMFTQVFWNEFNGIRGYNKQNLAMAQYLEAALDERGKFEEFTQQIKEANYDWERDVQRFATFHLDKALDIAKQVEPSLSYDVIREHIKLGDVDISVSSFANELKRFVDSKNSKDYRLVFFVDEISQFVDGRTNVLLQLQETVKNVMDACHSQVWFACTAQEDLTEVLQTANIVKTNELFGKILGRFEVRASLQSTEPEYITQKRILDKKPTVEMSLEEMYDENRSRLEAQFQLPAQYRAYKDKKDFAAYYPFVPYQFQLIMRVLDNFVHIGYVDRQVRGDERSLINITFSIAKETAQHEVGDFIPFDRFFGAMFQGSMQHLGRRAIQNARKTVEGITRPEKQEFATRVVNVMFMLCNMAAVDKQQFAANVDNISTLLMTKVDQSKAKIKADIAEVITLLEEDSVIRKMKSDNGTEYFEFYTEEESKVAKEIENQKVDANTYAEEMRKIFFSHFDSPANTVNYATNNFKVGANIEGRSYLSNNADIYVDFVTSSETDNPAQYALTAKPNRMTFFLCALFNENRELRDNFLHYCRVQKFAMEGAMSEERQRIKAIFTQRASELYKNEIIPAFSSILDTCPVIIGTNVFTAANLGLAKKKERYQKALTILLESLYTCAKLVVGPSYPKNSQELQQAIMKKTDPALFSLPLTDAEEKVKDYLVRKSHDVTVADLIQAFRDIPYGWAETATAYVVSELVRRGLYAFNYNNDPNVSRDVVAQKILREASRFTIEPAKAISQDLVNKFIDSWKEIFNKMSVPGSTDAIELFRSCQQDDKSELNNLLKNYRTLYKEIAQYPFAHFIEEAITLMEQWVSIRDAAKFFQTIIDAKESATELFNQCKNVNSFMNDQKDNYKTLREFITKNEDNFYFLPDEMAEAIARIKGIKDDEKPFDKMPQYMKLKREIEGKLKETEKKLKADIINAYNKAFDELEAYAESVKVDRSKFAQRDSTLLRLTTTSNFYALVNNANTQKFLTEQMDIITAAIKKEEGPKPRVRTLVKLDTHSTHPIRTEQDVDEYLASLKVQLMKHLADDNDIIIN